MSCRHLGPGLRREMLARPVGFYVFNTSSWLEPRAGQDSVEIRSTKLGTFGTTSFRLGQKEEEELSQKEEEKEG